MSKDDSTYSFNFYGNVGQTIAHVDVLNAHFDKDGNMQIANADNVNMTTPDTKKPTTKTKTNAAKITSATFTYRWIKTDEHRIAELYQRLLRAKWIDEKNPDNFMELFSGKESNCKIKWIGTRQHLAYLFKLLIEREYIIEPQSVGKWVVVCSHFVDKNSRQFRNMNKLADPVKANAVIDMMAEILNPANPLS